VGQEDMVMQQQQMEMANQPPPEDPNADKQHAREKEKLSLTDRTEAQRHSRDKERMRLQDTMETRKHKRDMEALRQKSKKPSPGKVKKSFVPMGSVSVARGNTARKGYVKAVNLSSKERDAIKLRIARKQRIRGIIGSNVKEV
jgi:hypothetical protein